MAALVLAGACNHGTAAPPSTTVGEPSDAGADAPRTGGPDAPSTAGADSSARADSSPGTSDGAAPRAGATCPGYQPTPEPTCRTDGDCKQTPFFLCTPYREGQACGGACLPRPRLCEKDTDCAAGTVCVTLKPGPCSCGPQPETRCQPACSAATCAADERCDPDGKCRPRPCTDGFACAAGEVCAPGRPGANPHGCAYALCSGDGYQCPAFWVCENRAGTNPHGCAPLPCNAGGRCEPYADCKVTAGEARCEQRACKTDGDCACGFCVQDRCLPYLFHCESPGAP